MKASHINAYDWERQRNTALYKQEQFSKKTKMLKEPKHKQYPKESSDISQFGWKNRKPLTDDEWEEFFWKKLVPMGWLIHNNSIVLACKNCNTILEQIDIKKVKDRVYDFDYYGRAKAILRCKECKNVPVQE